MAQFLQSKAAGQRVASRCFMFYSIRFLELFKYEKTENRPHMTDKSLNGTESVYTDKLNTRCIC